MSMIRWKQISRKKAVMTALMVWTGDLFRASSSIAAKQCVMRPFAVGAALGDESHFARLTNRTASTLGDVPYWTEIALMRHTARGK